ncbi:hypothetical protein [Nocardioides sp.]|uniref:hypothetical protein n=1 Tax=Nocardioides sp. TaxID=35761 RepID=UPI002BCBEBA1|nr:hypothetical protein [Nocardioides sp.]HSX68457.1 hypothetical protein [Nocardioides sp.]
MTAPITDKQSSYVEVLWAKMQGLDQFILDYYLLDVGEAILGTMSKADGVRLIRSLRDELGYEEGKAVAETSRCSGVRSDGEPCQAARRRGSAYCVHHEKQARTP